MDKKPEKLVPEVRFKGFTDDWEQHKLGDITIPIKTYPYTRKYETKNITKFKYIHYGDIHTGKAKKINEPSKLPSITKGNYSTLRNGDVVVADASEDYKGIADAAILLSTGAFSIIAGLHTIAFRPNRKLVFPMFIYYNLQTSRFKHYGYHVGTGLKVFGISSNLFFDYSAFHPSLIEQQEISKLIESLENLLSLQQRKLEQLMQLKKAMLQQLFVDKNCKQPILRFKNFNDNWEERKLSDIANYRNGKAHEQYIDMNGIYTVVNSKFISTNGKVKKFSNKPIELLKKGEIAFVLSDVPNGKALAKAYLIDSDNRYSLNQRIAGITPSSDINSYFLYILINRNRYFLKFDDGVGQTNLSKKDIEEFKENYPLFDEQQKIANLFSKIQILITLQQNKLTQLTTLKEYLLRKLFI